MMQFILLLLFFFSGLSALVYQTIWIRQFSLVFGVDVFATATVLTAFMAGLALGSYVFGRLVDRDNRPLRLFAFLELGIAVFGLLFPLSFKGLEELYITLYRSLSLGFYATQLYRFVLAFFFLLIPTMLMGGTLPVLSKIFVKKVSVLGANVGKLYSMNNLGALVGCFLSGFVLIRWLGQHDSLIGAAILNLCNAVVVFLLLLSKREIKSEAALPTEDKNEVAPLPSRVIRFVLWAFAIEGFAALAYEVIWTRILLGFSYDKSLYFFSTVIFSFIFGLSFGSILIAKIVDRKKNLLLLFAIIEILIAVCALVLLSGFVEVNSVLSEWRLQYRDADGWWRSMGKEYLLFFLIMAIPTTLMGMTFPIVGKICTPHLQRLGSRLGEIGFLDTAGSIIGSFAAGFIMIPFLGVMKSVVATAMINVIIGILAVLLNPSLSKRGKAPIIAATVAVVFVLLANLPDSRYFRHWQTKRLGDRLLYYQEGADAAVAVPQHTDGIKFLSINGSVTAFAEYGDIRVHKMLGYLPGFLHPRPQTSLVIGLGMGVTARSLLDMGLEQVDCVELNPGVVEAARDYFTTENNSALADSRLSIILDDGRSFLGMTEKKYDIITSNAVHARLSGNLYTREFYELCHDRLTADGIMCQWTSTNWLTPTEFRSLIAAFQQVFPHTSLWLVNAGHLLIIGTPTPLTIPLPLFAAHFDNAGIGGDLHRYGMGTPEMFLAHFVIDERRLPLFLKEAPVNSDDHPIAELSRVIDKMQIAEILLSLIQLKGDLSSRLVFADTQTPSEQSQFASSVASYAKAEKYYLESTFAHNIYGEPLLALNMLTLALQEQPNDYRYHEEAAGLNLYLAQQPDVIEKERDIYLDNTIAHLEAMTKITAEFAFDWNNLGYVYMNRQRLQEAEAAFKRALSLSSENALPLNYLASIMGAKGEWAEAERLLKQAIMYYPEEIESTYRLALVYERLQRRAEAKALYEQIAQVQPQYRDVGKRLQNL